LKRLLLAFLVALLLPAVVQATIGESQYHPLAVFVVAGAVRQGVHGDLAVEFAMLYRRSGMGGPPAKRIKSGS